MKRQQDERWFNDVFDLLVSIGGSPESFRFGFVHSHTKDNPPCNEYRFMGHLGWGGKYRRKTNTVDCYHEDLTPEREAIIERLNSKLENLKNEL